MRMCYCSCFFKQKTAYEMRISDWSSDVCSSDLPHLHRDAVDLAGVAEAGRDQHRFVAVVPPDETRPAAFHIGTRCGGEVGRHGGHAIRIGRESCREGVCKHV